MRRECRECFPRRGPPRVSDPNMQHGTRVTHVSWCMPGSPTSDFLWSQWRGKRSRHSRRIRNPQFYVSYKRPMRQASCLLYPSLTTRVLYIRYLHILPIIKENKTMVLLALGPDSLVRIYKECYCCGKAKPPIKKEHDDFPTFLSLACSQQIGANVSVCAGPEFSCSQYADLKPFWVHHLLYNNANSSKHTWTIMINRYGTTKHMENTPYAQHQHKSQFYAGTQYLEHK